MNAERLFQFIIILNFLKFNMCHLLVL